MLNFTGQTKKRTVRLGDRSVPLGPKGNGDYLQQARLQRIHREETRQREKSAVLLQRQIKKYLDLKSEGQVFETQWLEKYNQWDDERDWNVWLSQLPFLSKWIIPKENEDSINKFISIVEDIISQSQYVTTPSQHGLILNSLIELLSRIHTSRDMLIGCINDLLIKYPNIDSPKYSELVTLLTSCLTKGSISDHGLARDIALKIGKSQPISGIFSLLSRPNLFEGVVSGDESEDYLTIFKQIWDHSSISELTRLDNSAFISLIDNYLTLHTLSEFDEFDFKVLGTILENLTTISIRESSTQDSKSIEHVVATLYSTSFIKSAISFLSDDKESLRTSALHIISQLVSFHPPSKSKLCMLITITPHAFTNLFSAIKSHAIFKGFLSYTFQHQDYVRFSQINQIYGPLKEVDIRVFWDLISTFEEVYSYWLIISNDLESFSKERLSLEEVSNFLIFLKSLSLTLIFLGNKGVDLINDFTRLKNISISLLNQLYSKNLRLKFLPVEFWKLYEIKYDINALLPAVAEDEEKRVRDMDAVQEEEDGFGDLWMDIPQPPRRKSTNYEKIGGDVSYKLEILKKVPFFIGFNDRVKIFQFLIELDKQRNVVYNPFSFDDRNKLSGNIRRENLVHDAYNQFHTAGAGLKNQLSVAFFNQYGPEAGIDGGGITKEFLTSVVKEAFSPEFELELFKETAAENQIYPNDDIFKKINKQIDVPKQQERLQYLRFLGNIMGKCLYENILMEISFAPFFLNKWCNQNMKNSIDDLNYLDHELFVNLMKLINMSDEELNDLDLNFTINESIDKKNYSFDILPPNGETTQVNSSNKLNYIHQISNFKLNFSLHIQTRQFLEGLFQIVSSSWLSMFDCFELQMLISGAQNDINIQDWKENVEYGAYFDDDLTIKYFWEVVAEMKPEERFKLVKFVTSVSRAPLLGFQALSPKFGIRNSGSDRDRFPTASTCINLLKLPDYRDKELIRHKLLYAINTEAGFDLS
ncbi:ubiquitin-protein ligase [Scheffersomyces coipomensis]|uniref:ubiquitin-protein ligase n=1 Tax=Scheffersomyces coipomensis TaxID=1788519 RepID=UPI00315DDC52